ncbi:MAG: hypothetical protein F4061_16480 [Acidobacteria bacterium]|nr:hypothetical protein [Acidobacteriota bacterium]
MSLSTGVRRDRTLAVATCASAALLAAMLAFWWTSSDRYRLTGDEPHYVVLAASIWRDGDFDVRNNFDEDATTAEIYGPIPDRHVGTRNGRQYSHHQPLLSVLLALPFAIGGTVGARLFLCLLITPILGWAAWRWLHGRAPPADVAIALAGLLFCPVILFGSGQVYGNLLGGAVISALAIWLWQGEDLARTSSALTRREGRSPIAWMFFGVVAGLLPWLHMQYLAVTFLLGVFAIWQVWREQPWRDGIARDSRWGYTAGAVALVLGPATFFMYQMATLGQPFGNMERFIVETPYLRAAEVLIGNHLDQSHGLFWHQPLFFPGLIAIGWMAGRRHPLTIPWLLLYAALMTPPALLGTWSTMPIGRYNWAAFWLWLIPIGLWLRAERASLGRYVRPVALGVLAYQAILALRWVPDPTRLFNYAESPLVWARDSLFPLSVRYVFPHFFLNTSDGWGVVRYLEYLPNLIWVAAAALLFVTGWMWSAEGRRRLRPVWIGGVAVTALLLPVEPTADAESPTDDGLHEPMARSIQSTFPRRFEAERMTPMQTADRTTRLDEQASGGRARAADNGRSDGLMTFGPYLDMNPGRYRIEAAMRLRTSSEAAPAAWLDVRSARGQFAHGRVDVPAANLPIDGGYTTVSVAFDAVEPLEDLEFRVGAHPGVDLLVDYIDLIPVLP